MTSYNPTIGSIETGIIEPSFCLMLTYRVQSHKRQDKCPFAKPLPTWATLVGPRGYSDTNNSPLISNRHSSNIRLTIPLAESGDVS
jgi:hypothetical protein